MEDLEKYDKETFHKIQKLVEKFRSLEGWKEFEKSVYNMEVSDKNKSESKTLFSFKSTEGKRRFEIYDSGGKHEPWVWFANGYTGSSGNDPVLCFDPKTVRRKLTKKDKKFELHKKTRIDMELESSDEYNLPKPFVEEGILTS